jgi:tetratricopeptide (TPR) repeat protein
MDEDNDTIFNNNDYLAIFERCEHMLDSKIETYFDVYEFTELLDNYIEQGKLNKAYTLVQIAQKQHPNNTELEFRKARIHIERNDFETAVDILKKLLRIEEDNSDYHICIGVAYTYKHDFTAAVKHFTIGITLSPENEEDNLYNIGVTFLNVDNYKLAYDYLWQAYTKYPNNLLALYDLAYCCERLQQYETSIQLYKQYIDADPYSEYAWFNLALVYLQSEEIDEAIQAFDYAITINESFSSAHFNKANCYMTKELYNEAILCYQDVLQFEPENIYALQYIAECYEKLGEIEHSMATYEKITEIAPEYGEGWYGIALLHFYNNNTQKALELFEKALELDSQNDKYLISYGIALSDCGMYPKAIQIFKQAIAINKFEFEAWIQYSQIEMELNNPNVAKKILRQGIEAAPHATLYFTLAAYHANEHDIPKAIDYFKKGYSLDPEYATMYFFDICHLPLNSLQLFYNEILK